MRIKPTIMWAATLVVLFPFGLLGMAWLLLHDKAPKVVSGRSAVDDLGDNAVAGLTYAAAGYNAISAREVKERLEDEGDNGFIVLDVRNEASYETGHIPGAINIPLRELGYGLFDLDMTKDIIVYCNLGLQGSAIACQVLARAGFKDVYNITGGIDAWDYAIETSDGTVNI